MGVSKKYWAFWRSLWTQRFIWFFSLVRSCTSHFFGTQNQWLISFFISIYWFNFCFLFLVYYFLCCWRFRYRNSVSLTFHSLCLFFWLIIYIRAEWRCNLCPITDSCWLFYTFWCCCHEPSIFHYFISQQFLLIQSPFNVLFDAWKLCLYWDLIKPLFSSEGTYLWKFYCCFHFFGTTSSSKIRSSSHRLYTRFCFTTSLSHWYSPLQLCFAFVCMIVYMLLSLNDNITFECKKVV